MIPLTQKQSVQRSDQASQWKFLEYIFRLLIFRLKYSPKNHYFDFCGEELYLVVFRSYSWFCTQESLLTGNIRETKVCAIFSQVEVSFMLNFYKYMINSYSLISLISKRLILPLSDPILSDFRHFIHQQIHYFPTQQILSEAFATTVHVLFLTT